MKLKDRMLKAIQKEITSRKDYFSNFPVETIYIGGGTPSILSIDEIKGLLATVFDCFDCVKDLELTLEANPEDLNMKYLIGLKSLGINRLSIGVQSFIDSHLRFLNRRHTAIQAEQCIREAKEEGFNNLNIDLIYGIPELTIEEWGHNLDKIFEYNIPHLSAYHLTIEAKTVFGVYLKKRKLKLSNEASSCNSLKFYFNK